MEFNYLKSFNDSSCSTPMVYLRYGPSMTTPPPKDSAAACENGLQINRREFGTGQYVPDAAYMDIIHSFMWEKALDGACVGGGADYFVRASCATRSYAVYKDAVCATPVPLVFETALPRISCSIPNPTGTTRPAAPSPAFTVQFSQPNCSGLVQSIRPELPRSQPAAATTCRQGAQTLVNASTSANATYMTLVSTGGRTFSLLDRTCAPVSQHHENYALANCATGSVTFFADAACTQPRPSTPATLADAVQSFPVYSLSCNGLVQPKSTPTVLAHLHFPDRTCSNAHVQSVVYITANSASLPPLDQYQDGRVLSTTPPPRARFASDKLYMNVTLNGAAATVLDRTCAPLLDGYVYANCAALSVLLFHDPACSQPQGGIDHAAFATVYKTCFVPNVDPSTYYLEIVGGFAVVVLVAAAAIAAVQHVRKWRAARSGKRNRNASDTTDLAVSPMTSL